MYEVTWKTVMQIAKKHAVSGRRPLPALRPHSFPFLAQQKSAVAHLQKMYPGQKSERIFMNWTWWILAGLPFPHLIRVMDCFLHEGIKVFYRISLAILILYQKHVPTSSLSIDANAVGAASSSSSSATSKTNAKSNSKFDADWKTNNDDKTNDIENVLPNFCRNIPVSPGKLLRTAFNIRALRYVLPLPFCSANE